MSLCAQWLAEAYDPDSANNLSSPLPTLHMEANVNLAFTGFSKVSLEIFKNQLEE